MKMLYAFARFDWEAFSKGKAFEVTSVNPWKDFQDSNVVLGTAVEVVIMEDKTIYPPSKDGITVSNRYEKLTFKVPKKSLAIAIGDIVEPVNAVATVFGKYRNQLSVKAEDMKIVLP